MRVTTPPDLNKIMEFDRVVTVTVEGRVIDGPGNLYAPDLYDGVLDDSAWQMLDGYSGQYGYSGPVMHNSEFIGGSLAVDILSTPGIYTVVVADWSPDSESGEDEDSDTVEGWAVCRYVGPKKERQ